MGLRVEVIKERCISSGRCVADEPSAFGFDGDELAEPLPGAAALGRQRLLDAARDCPGEAIVVYEHDISIALE